MKLEPSAATGCVDGSTLQHVQAMSKEDKIKLEPSVATGCVDGSTPMV